MVKNAVVSGHDSLKQCRLSGHEPEHIWDEGQPGPTLDLLVEFREVSCRLALFYHRNPDRRSRELIVH